MRGLALAAAGCVIAACGIDAVGTQQDLAPLGSDAGVSAPPPPPDAPPVASTIADGGAQCGSGTCGLTVPQGWTLVTMTDGATACPTGFTSTDIVESPTAPPAACTCACSVTSAPTCKSTAIMGTKYDSSGSPSCTSTANAQEAIADGTCKSANMAPGNHELFPSPAPTATTCSATATADKTAVQTTKSRICAAPTCADACGSGAFKTCLVAAGDQTCPAGVPDKHLVGSGADVTCPSCSCTPNGPAKCTGTWTLYTDGSCGTVHTTLQADVCTATGSTLVKSYKWTPNAVSASCTANPAAGTASLVGTSTVCCK